jgi:hypothetical protein
MFLIEVATDDEKRLLQTSTNRPSQGNNTAGSPTRVVPALLVILFGLNVAIVIVLALHSTSSSNLFSAQSLSGDFQTEVDFNE